MFSFFGLLTIYLMSNEIMDMRETRYAFRKPEELAIDMKMFAERIKDLEGVDSINFAHMFPPRNIVNEYLILNRAYKQHLTQVRELYPESRSVQNAIEETQILYDIYDNIRDSQCEYYYIHVRRLALKKLKQNLDKIDPTWYEKGILPPYLPFWRFNEIK